MNVVISKEEYELLKRQDKRVEELLKIAEASQKLNGDLLRQVDTGLELIQKYKVLVDKLLGGKRAGSQAGKGPQGLVESIS